MLFCRGGEYWGLGRESPLRDLMRGGQSDHAREKI